MSWAVNAIGSCITAGLIDRDYAASKPVGRPVRLQRSGVAVEPFDELGRFLRGEITPDAWAERVRALGIAELDLGRSSLP